MSPVRSRTVRAGAAARVHPIADEAGHAERYHGKRRQERNQPLAGRALPPQPKPQRDRERDEPDARQHGVGDKPRARLCGRRLFAHAAPLPSS